MKYKIGDIIKITKQCINHYKNIESHWWRHYNLKEDCEWRYIGHNRYQSLPEGSHFSNTGEMKYAIFGSGVQFELAMQKSKEEILLEKISSLYGKNKFTKERGYDKLCSEKGTMP